MKGDSFISYEKADSDRIFSLLKFQFCDSGIPEVASFPVDQFTEATSIKEWFSRCELSGCYEVGQSFNLWLRLDVPPDEWFSLMHPEEEKKIGDLVKFLKMRVELPLLNAGTILGHRAPVASAFFSLRFLLIESGIPAQLILPAALLSDTLKTHGRILFSEITRIAPGALQAPVARIPALQRLVFWLWVPWFLFLVIGGIFKVELMVNIAVLFLFLFFLLAPFASHIFPAVLKFEEVGTYGELAQLLAQSSSQSSK